MALPRLPRLVVYGLVALAAVLLLGGLAQRLRPAVTQWRLQRALRRIEPWPTTTNYSATGWQRLVAAATAFQRASPALAGEVLQSYLERAARRPADLATEQARVFLLLRVMFALPEAGQPAEVWDFGGWRPGPTAVHPDGTVNLAWPVIWNGGRPRLAAGRDPAPRPAYAAQKEFAFLRYKFPPRDLSSYRP